VRSFPQSGFIAEPRCYTTQDICRALKLSRRHFSRLLVGGRLPFLIECQPRLGRKRRYVAEPVDRYLAAMSPVVPTHIRRMA
jgi:excisionase family DNA binding protein